MIHLSHFANYFLQFQVWCIFGTKINLKTKHYFGSKSTPHEELRKIIGKMQQNAKGESSLFLLMMMMNNVYCLNHYPELSVFRKIDIFFTPKILAELLVGPMITLILMQVTYDRFIGATCMSLKFNSSPIIIIGLL